MRYIVNKINELQAALQMLVFNNHGNNLLKMNFS